MHRMTSVELRAGDLRLALRPDLGGVIAGLWRNGVPVLRSTEPQDLTAARNAGCYPLVPYSGRLGYRRFRWLGKDHSTQPNFSDSPHSLHGVSWMRAWSVVSSSEHEAELALEHAGDADWPFAFSLRQRFMLTGDLLEVQLGFTNRAAHPQPVGLGWHPYFPKRPRSRLHIESAGRWETDATGLPTRRVPAPGIDADIAHLDFDHCFDGWTGSARIRDEKHSLRLTASMPYLVVFTPPTREYFCVEPVSHVSNAIHMSDPLAHGLQSLAPGATAQAWMKLSIGPV